MELDSKLKTFQHNKEGFTRKQVKAAMDARSAMHVFGAPSIKNLKYAIRLGLIKNCPITEEALQHAEAISACLVIETTVFETPRRLIIRLVLRNIEKDDYASITIVFENQSIAALGNIFFVAYFIESGVFEVPRRYIEEPIATQARL